MLKAKLNIWSIISLITIIIIGVIFFKIVIYLSISLVLFLIGYPITYQLEKLKIRQNKLSNSLAALITLALFIVIIFGLGYLIIIPLTKEIKFLSNLNFFNVMQNILTQFPSIKSILLKFGSEEDLKQNLSHQLSLLASTNNLSYILNNIFEYISAIIGGTLCVIFITFFLLKDESIVKENMLLLSSKENENRMLEILKTSKKMLSKYFSSLLLDMFILASAVFITLSFLGINNVLLIAFCAGILNIIPYIGSIITLVIAISLGVSSCISLGSYDLIEITIYKIFFGLLSINLIDALILQPLIFSKSIKAHPLEIFIVTLMAAILGGVIGMIIALPIYTIIRIISKEFLSHLKIFKKISETISN